MGKQFEKNLLRLLFIISIGSFFNLIRKPPIKDWLIIFFLKSYIATFIDNIAVRRGYIVYPVNLFKTFDVSVLFSYLLFPISCVYYNQVTRNSNLLGIIIKCLLFSVPSTIAEHWLEKNTQLIKYKKSWTSLHSFASMAFTFLLVRFLIAIIRKFAQKQNEDPI